MMKCTTTTNRRFGCCFCFQRIDLKNNVLYMERFRDSEICKCFVNFSITKLRKKSTCDSFRYNRCTVSFICRTYRSYCRTQLVTTQSF